MGWKKYKSLRELPDPVPPGKYIVDGVRVVSREPSSREAFITLVKSVKEIARKQR